MPPNESPDPRLVASELRKRTRKDLNYAASAATFAVHAPAHWMTDDGADVTLGLGSLDEDDEDVLD